jgi:hypothetical protein
MDYLHNFIFYVIDHLVENERGHQNDGQNSAYRNLEKYCYCYVASETAEASNEVSHHSFSNDTRLRQRRH